MKTNRINPRDDSIVKRTLRAISTFRALVLTSEANLLDEADVWPGGELVSEVRLDVQFPHLQLPAAPVDRVHDHR